MSAPLENLRKNMLLRVIELGIKHPDGFTYSDIIDNGELRLTSWEKEILDRYFTNAFRNLQGANSLRPADAETIFLVLKTGENPHTNNSWLYTINLDTHFKYIDYLELREARENAKEARKLASWAILVSVIAIVVSIFVPSFITQEVQLPESQIQGIKDIFNENNDVKG